MFVPHTALWALQPVKLHTDTSVWWVLLQLPCHNKEPFKDLWLKLGFGPFLTCQPANVYILNLPPAGSCSVYQQGFGLKINYLDYDGQGCKGPGEVDADGPVWKKKVYDVLNLFSSSDNMFSNRTLTNRYPALHLILNQYKTHTALWSAVRTSQTVFTF